jgi:hypothetical protein
MIELGGASTTAHDPRALEPWYRALEPWYRTIHAWPRCVPHTQARGQPNA